jgi:hypothetical protein
MGSSSRSDADIECLMKWKLCRRHGWSQSISKRDLAKATVGSNSSDIPRAERIADGLKKKPYVIYQRQRGFSLKGMPEIERLAYELRDQCSYTEFQIETTVSPFERAGGFDDEDDS